MLSGGFLGLAVHTLKLRKGDKSVFFRYKGVDGVALKSES